MRGELFSRLNRVGIRSWRFHEFSLVECEAIP